MRGVWSHFDSRHSRPYRDDCSDIRRIAIYRFNVLCDGINRAFRSRQRRRVRQGYIPACRIQVEDTDWGVAGDTACGACDTSKRGSRPADLALEARRIVYAPHRGHLISMCVASPLASRRLQCGQRISLISITRHLTYCTPAPCLLCVARSSRAQPQAETLHDDYSIVWGRGPAYRRRAGGGGSNLPRLCLKRL